MTQDEIIRMAREAGLIKYVQVEKTCVSNALERFAAIVAAHERNRHAWTQEHWTEYEHAIAAAHEREKIQAQLKAARPQGKSWLPFVLEAMLAEREACAKVCDAIQKKHEDEGAWLWEARNCAAAIRARGE